MRSRLDSTTIQPWKKPVIRPNRSGNDAEVEAWFDSQLSALQSHIRGVINSPLFMDDFDDRSHIQTIYNEIEELEEEREHWRKVYKAN
jgi:hypothetical protein